LRGRIDRQDGLPRKKKSGSWRKHTGGFLLSRTRKEAGRGKIPRNRRGELAPNNGLS